MTCYTTKVTDGVSPRAGTEVRVARSLPEVEALRSSWQGWPGHRDSEIDFYSMIVQSYPEVVRPHVITLYRNGEPEAVLVGRLERARVRFGVGYLTLFRPWARCLTIVQGAVRGDSSPENTQMLVREVINSLGRHEADMARVELVSLDAPLYQLALKVPGFLSRDILPTQQVRYSTAVPGSIDEVYRRMSGRRSKFLRSLARKLQRNPAGEPRIVCYQHPSELEQLFRDAERIAERTYQRGLGVGFGDDPLVRKRLELLAHKSWLRAYLLYLGDRPCAFWIGFLKDETFVSEYLGYNPEFREYSPGMFLIMRVIEGFCKGQDGDVAGELDWGPGDAEYKAALSTAKWQEASVYIFSPTPKGLLLKVMRTSTRMADALVRKILHSTKFLARLKRAWRDRLATRGQNLSPERGNAVSRTQPGSSSPAAND